MRVAIVTSARLPPEEGIGFHVCGLANELLERGHSVVLLATTPESGSANKQGGIPEGAEIVQKE